MRDEYAIPPRVSTRLTRQETAAPSRLLQQWRIVPMTDIIQPLRRGRILRGQGKAKYQNTQRPEAPPHCSHVHAESTSGEGQVSLSTLSAWTSRTSASDTPFSIVSSCIISSTFPRPPLLLRRRLDSASLRLLLGGSPLASFPTCVTCRDRAIVNRTTRESPRCGITAIELNYNPNSK